MKYCCFINVSSAIFNKNSTKTKISFMKHCSHDHDNVNDHRRALIFCTLKEHKIEICEHMSQTIRNQIEILTKNTKKSESQMVQK